MSIITNIDEMFAEIFSNIAPQPAENKHLTPDLFDTFNEKSNSAEIVKSNGYVSLFKDVEKPAKIALKTKNDTNAQLEIKTYLTTEEEFIELADELKLTEKAVFLDSTLYSFHLTPLKAFILRHWLKGKAVVLVGENTANALKAKADTVPLPKAELTDKDVISVTVPRVNFYTKLLKKLSAYPKQDGTYSISLMKIFEFKILAQAITNFPKISLCQKLRTFGTEKISGFNGNLESLRNIDLEELKVISANKQSYINTRKSKETIADKMRKMGISNLYELLFWLPRRYIDRSNPQNIKDLIEGETAVILGKIENVTTNGATDQNVVFTIRTNKKESIKAVFFNQHWLKRKFLTNAEVIIVGKTGYWGRDLQIIGSTIEHADEVALMEIVPVYNQSPSKGITTYTILVACKELLSRLSDLRTPTYLTSTLNKVFTAEKEALLPIAHSSQLFAHLTEGLGPNKGLNLYRESMPKQKKAEPKKEEKFDLYQTLYDVHFPESLMKQEQAYEKMAVLELIYLQLLIRDKQTGDKNKKILNVKGSEKHKLQKQAIDNLPFTLTDSQVQAITQINENLASASISSTVLSADVGSGKTVIAQLAALKTVETGYQVAIAAPTEVLARQLFEGMVKVAQTVKFSDGKNVKVDYLYGKMKAKEKKEILTSISTGETNIVIGTHSLFTDSVQFKNLGLLVIDEEQKFGVDQRDALLHTRKDGKLINSLIMTATPIPRTAAQVFYGDMNIIELKEKPAGRLPITTIWLKENPADFITQISNSVWQDIVQEAEKGNQTFIITPLVEDSDKIEAASVEKTYRMLQSGTLSTVKIDYVHGKMKPEEQREKMTAFKNGKFDVLIASKVVEVGVDIKNATIVVILSAERMGASSLHQIRGRVGRNDKPSRCYLVSEGKTKNSVKRLSSLVENSDGFKIAENDLETRGEGEIFGTQQSGKTNMRFANVVKNMSQIAKTREIADQISQNKNWAQEAVTDAKNMFQIQ